MSRGSFLTGLSTGVINGLAMNRARERDEKKDKADEEDRALRREEQQMRMQALRQEAADRQTLRDAGTDRVALPGTAVTTGAGDKNLYADPAQAAAAAEEAAIEAEMRGQDPAAVTSQAATGVTGAMSKGHQITTAPVDVAALNTPDAKGERVLAALDGIDPLKAMDARHVQTQRKREDIKFTQEQTAYAKKLADEGVIDAVRALRRGDAKAVAEAFNRGGEHRIEGDIEVVKEMRTIKGLGEIPTYTAKGKMKMPDGTLKEVSFNSHDLGMSLMPYEQALNLQYKGVEAADKSLLRASQAEAASARAEASRARAAGGTGAKDAGTPTFNALEGWDPKQAQTAATKQVDEMLISRGTPATPEERAQLINRQVFALRDSWQQEASTRERARVFAAIARQAQTPEEIAAVRARAAQSGYTDAEMVAIDKRFAPQPAPTQAAPAAASGTGKPTPKPVPAPGSSASTSAPAAPAQQADPLAAAMGIRGDGSAIDKALSGSVPAVRQAGAAVATAKAQLAAAARSGDPQAVTQYAQALQEARNGLDALLKNMNKAQADQVRAAAGY